MAPGWALGAALLTTCSPHLISMTTYVLSETLFTFLALLSLWLLLGAAKAGRRTLASMAGLAIAAAALTRPTLQYFIVSAAVLLVLYGRHGTRRRLVVSLVIGFMVLFMPWQLQNLLVTGAASDSTLTINALHHGMYPDFRYQDRPKTTGFPYRFDPHNKEFSTGLSTVLKEIGRRFREEPARRLRWYLLGKPATLLSWDIIAGGSDAFAYPVRISPFLKDPAYNRPAGRYETATLAAGVPVPVRHSAGLAAHPITTAFGR